uniref:DNA binding protein n=1 Tax=Rhizophora mucronata TaxID=61149 RepID=A0A2P2JG18_RHIMU
MCPGDQLWTPTKVIRHFVSLRKTRKLNVSEYSNSQKPKVVIQVQFIL